MNFHNLPKYPIYQSYPSIGNLMYNYFYQDADVNAMAATKSDGPFLSIEIVAHTVRAFLDSEYEASQRATSKEIELFLAEFPDENTATEAIKQFNPEWALWEATSIRELFQDLKRIIDHEFPIN